MSKIRSEAPVNKGPVNLENTVVQARDMVRQQEHESAVAQQDALSLEQELRELQVAEQRRKEAEDRGKETAEKMEEVAG